MGRKGLLIGETAKLLGITQKAIRHYHKIGLLPEPNRSEGGYRLYEGLHLNRLRRIRILQSLGLSLARIDVVLGEPHAPSSMEAVLQSVVVGLNEEIETLTERRSRVQKILNDKTYQCLDALPEPEWAEKLLNQSAEEAAHIHPQSLEQILEMDRKLYGAMDAYHWPGETRARLEESLVQMQQIPNFQKTLAPVLARFAQLAELPECSVEVEAVVDDLFPIISKVTIGGQTAPSPFGNTLASLVQEDLSPAQKRAICLIQERAAKTGS